MQIFMLGMIVMAFAASPFILLILHVLARDRISKLERSVHALSDGHEKRLQALEARLEALAGGRPSEGAVDDRSLRGDVSSRQRAEAGVRESAAAAAPAAPEVSSTAPSVSPTTPSVSSMAPSVSSPARTAATAAPSRSSAEWEELIGGSWLNKVGVLVTVIGIALALGYSMAFLGPTGRVALALALSGAMLGGGALLEVRERYRIFARGLIGGGWAGLYFTTFAMHGLEAARIIESPVIGTGLLIAVAVGMVLHSLVYRSETVTALAYFVTFATLAVVPMSRFALFASLPAAASLLYVGRRFHWKHMMVAGIVLTYGVYLLRGGSADVRPEDWAFGQALLFVYWIMFESFDVLSGRGREPGSIAETLMPLNAAGFIGTSLLGWSAARADTLWVFFVVAAGLFAASAAVRALNTPATAAGDADADVIGRLVGGGYEAALTLSAVMLLFGIERGFDGWHRNVAWLLEAQLLVLSGLSLRNSFLRHLGSAILAVPVAAVIIDDLPSGAAFVAAGHSWWRSTPLALLTAAVLYVDRALVRRGDGARVAGLEHLYNWAGTFLIVAVLANELPEVWIAPAWFAFGLGLIVLSSSRGAAELFLQGYVVAALSWLVMTLANVPTGDLVWGWPARWATAAPMILILFGLAYARRESRDLQNPGSTIEPATMMSPSVGGEASTRTGLELSGLQAAANSLERGAAATAFVAATFLLAWFLGFEVSGRWLTVAWGLQGAALLVAGFGLQERRVRVSGLVLLGVCVGKLFFYDAAELETIFRIFSFIILGALLLAVSFAYSRYREHIRKLL